MKKFLKKLYKILAVIWHVYIGAMIVLSSILVLYYTWTNDPQIYDWLMILGLFTLLTLSYEIRDIHEGLTNVRENQRTLIGLIYKIFN